MKHSLRRPWARVTLVSLCTALMASAAVPATAATPIETPAALTAMNRLALANNSEAAELPDPMDRGSYTAAVIQETKLGLVDLQEPNSAGAAPGTGNAQSPESLQIRGQLYYPEDRSEPSPVLILVHGNHGSCDTGQNSTTVSCTNFKRNEAGYAYMAENLATWGYTTFSVSMDQLMMRQDNAKGKGMHQRRLLIAAALDALSAANAAGGLPVDENTTIGTTLVGKLDMSRIGLMGHSRGGDAVTSFIDYNRQRTDGPRYNLRGVIALAPVDYERKAPYGTPFMAILPWCDGDVSNLQGARFFERSQYINPGSPFPSIQVSHQGANHNWYNTVWFADGQDGGTTQDAACGNSAPTNNNNVQPNNLRLSGAASYSPWSYIIDNSDTFNPLVNTKISGDAERMGDQEKIGLASMGSFFRRYVGGEGAFEPYMTGELSDTEDHLQIPQSACPTSESGTRIGCEEYVTTSYFPGSQDRVDIIQPAIQNPLTVNSLGGELTGEGFAYPYLDNGGVILPDATEQGFDWCNPEPDHFAPSQLGLTTQPTGAKACPLPAKAGLGGQNGTRENSPVNMSYGRQLAVAWEDEAVMTATIPAASKDASGFKALALAADVNYFDSRNPGSERSIEGVTQPVAYDPSSTTQDFVIALTDTKGNVGTVNAGDERWGNALHMSPGTNNGRVHIVLEQIRVPLTEFTAQGVDVSSLASLELKFGVEGTPASGSIQLADVRFQEKVGGDLLLSDGTAIDQGAGFGPDSGTSPSDLLDAYNVSAGNLKLIDTTGVEGAGTTWIVDNDRVECPAANFTSIQQAVDFASPWDTIVVCAGTYEEKSTPVYHASNPVSTGSLNGLTITKPLKIKGVGASKVTIKPDQSLESLGGLTPYLRDGGGNVITVSRQSLGSTDTNEMFVDISGVTVTSGDVFAEAGIAFFGAAGRVSESVVGPLKVAGSASELAENPHGWGIVQTGIILGSGKGTVDTQVSVVNSEVKGYQSGGILFDGGRGADGAPDNTVRTGIKQHGYVVGSVITGKPNSVYAQTGVKYANGTDGFVRTSRITGNYFRPDPAKSFGILLTDAGTDTAGALTGATNAIFGNGFAVYNAIADGSAVRTGAPFVLTGSYVGTANPAQDTPANPSTGVEGISGSSSVTIQSRASSIPATAASGVGAIANGAPTAAVVDPDSSTLLEVGDTLRPLVKASDDFAVKSVELVVNGESVETLSRAPYRFSWEIPTEAAGTDLEVKAIVTDALGRVTTTAAVELPVESLPTLSLADTAAELGASTADVAATVNKPGTLVLSGDDVDGVAVEAESAGEVTVPVALTAEALAELKATGTFSAAVTVTFTDALGKQVTTPATVTYSMTLPTVVAGAVTSTLTTGATSVKVTVNGAGTVAATGTGLTPTSATATEASTITVPLKLTATQAKALATKGTFTTTVTLTFTNADGQVITTTKSVTFKQTKPTVKVGKVTLNTSKGTASVAVTVNGKGKVVASGSKIKTATVASAKASTVKVPITLTASQAKVLKAKKSLKVSVKYTFTNQYGGVVSKTVSVTLKRK